MKPSKKIFDKGFQDNYAKITILIKGQKRIGFYQLTEIDKQIDITKLFLSPKYQSKGIGGFLMRHFETLGYKEIMLQVWDNNPAYNFFKKLGYETTAKKNHKYHMRKLIRS